LEHYRPDEKTAMKKELSLKKALTVQCPTCGAAPDEKCELTSGQPRTDPHRERLLVANDRSNAKRR
jgi:hypothetical protein